MSPATYARPKPSSSGAVTMRRNASGDRTTSVVARVGRTEHAAVVGRERDGQVGAQQVGEEVGDAHARNGLRLDYDQNAS